MLASAEWRQLEHVGNDEEADDADNYQADDDHDFLLQRTQYSSAIRCVFDSTTLS